MAYDVKESRRANGEAAQVHVRGIASDVTLDKGEHVAVKVYRRNRFVETLYHLAFQANFPYVDNWAALKAAQYRRKIAGLITKYFLGENVVTPVVAVEQRNGRLAFITELVEGGDPKDHHRARAFLHEVTEAFISTGLPTWQVSPHNPRSLGNVQETEDGRYRIIDLESNVVTPMIPVTGAWASAREAHLPPFDDIDLLKLWRFLDRHWEDIEQRLGPRDARQLITATAKYAWYEQLWHREEPRLWNRALRALTRVLDVPGHLRAIAHRVSGWSNNSTVATGWLQPGIERWRAEGRLTAEQASAADQDLSSAETLAVLAHLGAHLTMSIPLRFPLGSVARFLWTLAFRARSEARALIHRHADEETKRAREVHSAPVMLAAALPGVGAAAYVLAAPLRKNRILMAVALDQALRLLPLRLHERLHVTAITVRLANERTHRRPGSLIAETTRILRQGFGDLKIFAVALVPIAMAAVLLSAAVGYLSVTGNHDVVGEMGAVATGKLVMSLVAAAAGLIYFRSFWRVSDEGSPGAAGTLFWLVAGLGAAWVATDDYFNVHEAVIDAFPTPDFLDAVAENADKIVQPVYAAAAILLLRLFWGEISVRPGAALLVAAGLLLGAGALGVEALKLNGSDWAALEESLHLLAAGSIVSAILVNYVALRRHADR